MLTSIDCTNISHTAYQQIEYIQDVSDCLQTHSPSAALVTLTLYFANRELSGATASTTQFLLEQIRSLTRRTDTVLLYRHTAFFILPGADIRGAHIVQERLWDAITQLVLRTNGGPTPLPWNLVIGHSAYPVPSASAQDCIDAAHVVDHSLCLNPEQSAVLARSASIDAETDDADEHDLSLLARKLGIPYLSLLPRSIAPHLSQIISPALAAELQCLPVGSERNTLTVALSDPTDKQTLKLLHQRTGMRIFPVLMHPLELQKALTAFSHN